MSKQKTRFKDAKAKREAGGFVAMPHVILRHKSFANLSPHALKLLFDLLAQYRGDNNGDFCAAWTVMKPRGWKSKATLAKAIGELKAGRWILVSRQGGRHKPSLYAKIRATLTSARPVTTAVLREIVHPCGRGKGIVADSTA